MHPNKLTPKFKKIKKSLYDKQRRQNNKEADKERYRKLYLKNREKILVQQHERYLKTKEQKKIYNHKYHKRKKI